MKSERELLRENLERFRTARSHKTEDPGKGRKFQKLNESDQSSDKKLKSFAEKVKERWGKCYYTYEGPDYIALISVNDNCDPTVHEGIFEREALKAGVSIAMFEEDYDSVCLEGYIVNSQNTFCIFGPCSVGDFPSLEEYLDSLASNLADEREEYDLRTVEHDDWCGLSWQLVSDEFGIEFDRDGEVVAGPFENYGHFDNDTEDELSWEAAGSNTDHLTLNGEDIHTKEQYEKLKYLFDNYEFIEEDYEDYLQESHNLGVRGKHPIKDPAKRSPKFRKLNEVEEPASSLKGFITKKENAKRIIQLLDAIPDLCWALDSEVPSRDFLYRSLESGKNFEKVKDALAHIVSNWTSGGPSIFDTVYDNTPESLKRECLVAADRLSDFIPEEYTDGLLW